MVRSAGVAPAFRPWHSRVLLLDDDRMKWCSREELRLLPLCIFCSAPHDRALSRTALHLDPPPSHGGMHNSYTSGA